VCKQKKWAEIGRDLGYSGKIMSSLSTSLKNSYQKWLHPYEEYLRVVKPGVQQMLEFEHGGPFTPSPAHSPMKKSAHGTPVANASDSPAMRASAALNATLHSDVAPTPPAESQRAAMPSGFTPVNSGGFTSVNSQTPQATPAQPSAPGSFSTLNTPNGFHREHVDSRTATPLRNGGSPMLSAHNTPDLRPTALGLTPLSNGQVLNQLKRTLSQDAEDSSNGDADENGRRSKRLKKGKQNCAAVSLHLPSEQGCRVIASVLIQARVRRALHMPLVDLLANATTCRCGAHRCGLAHDPTTPIDARLDVLSPGTCHG
jgi:histone demethylase JARID1